MLFSRDRVSIIIWTEGGMMVEGLLQKGAFDLLPFPPQDTFGHLIDRDDSAFEIDCDEAIGHRGKDIVRVGFQGGDFPEAFLQFGSLESDLARSCS